MTIKALAARTDEVTTLVNGVAYARTPTLPINIWRMRAYQNNPQSMANGATVTVALDTIDYDDAGGFSTSTNAYTIPVTGIYYVFGGVTARLNQSPQGIGIAIAKGGSPLYDFVGNSCTGITSSTYYVSGTIADNLRFVQGDQITLQATNLSGGGAAVPIAYAWLAIHIFSA